MVSSSSRPQLLASVPSTESSPPPSPVPMDLSAPSAPQPGVSLNHHKYPYLPPLSSSSHRQPLAASASHRSNIPTRPRLPGRQETPPSPPNSVLLEQSPTSQSPHTIPEPIAESPSSNQLGRGSSVEVQGPPEHQTPPPSLKDRLTRVLKVGHRRGESDVSMSTNANSRDGGASASGHRHNNSGSTVGASITVAAQNLKENQSILQTYSSRAGPGYSPSKPDFYLHQWASPIRPNSQNHYTYGHGGTKHKVMKGGEVRVEILPHPSLAAEIQSAQDVREGFGSFGGRRKGHGRHAINKHGMEDVSEDERDEGDDDDGYHIDTPASLLHRRAGTGSLHDQYLEPYRRCSDEAEGSLAHNGTANTGSRLNTGSSSNSQERKFIEDATLSLGFEDFHIGDTNRTESGGFFAGLASPEPGSGSVGVYSTSGMASSGVLNSLTPSDMNGPARSSSSLLNCHHSKTNSSLSSLLGMSVNASGSSYYLATQRGSSGNLPNSGSAPYDEAVSRELKRLSKISAGSGVSGVAIVVTADGAASTRVTGGISDDEGEEVQRWTKEEKGKGRAVRSIASGNGSMAERTGSDTRAGNRKDHTRSGSGVSGWAIGDQSTSGSGSSSEGGDDDSKGLLKGVDQSGKRKLKSQSAPRGVLVHEGDARYNFVYRMRQTSDETPILVPQYTFAPDSSFPNRNALTLPIPAKPSSRNLRGVLSATRFGGSLIAKPEGAIVRPSGPQGPYYAAMQGDQAVDSYPNSPDLSLGDSGSHNSVSQSMSDNKMAALVHPALRKSSKAPAYTPRSRAVVSMGSLEGIVGIGMKSFATGTPGRTGGRTVGSSLADTSDPGYALEDSPAKDDSPFKRVRVGVNHDDDITPAPEPHSEDSKQNVPNVQRKKSLRVQVTTGRLVRPKDLRRSMTPRLYDPRPLGDSRKDLTDLESLPDREQTIEYRKREAKAGRILLGFCLLFPPLLLVVAWGGLDATVEGWTSGQVKGVGEAEKRLAAWVGGIFAVCVVVGIIVGSVLVSV